MKKKEKENYIILERENDLESFVVSIEQHLNEFKEKNLVIDLFDEKELSLDQLLSLLPISERHREGKRSFVVVNDAVNLNEVPEELHVVPTLGEAEDIIQMEEIERDLGF